MSTTTHTPHPDLSTPVDFARIGRDDLRALQLERLQWTVRHAYENVPLYRRKFDEVGVSPDAIRTLEDVRLLPFTSADVRLEEPGALPRSEGKYKRVYDLR